MVRQILLESAAEQAVEAVDRPRTAAHRLTGAPSMGVVLGVQVPRKETIPIEANCNCERATNRGEEAGSETAGR